MAMIGTCLSDVERRKYLNETARSWDIFYKRNTTNFYKDRHWILKEFPILLQAEESEKTLLEIGCGVGNFSFPISQALPKLFINCFDFSPRAIDLVLNNVLYDPKRMNAFVADLAIPNSPMLKNLKVDFVSNLFCLSAIPPQNHQIAIGNIVNTMSPGAYFIFRDYGLNDCAHVRFQKRKDSCMDPTGVEPFFIRNQDSTFSYFFTVEYLVKLCSSVGLQVIKCQTVVKTVVNRKESLSMDRIFVQGVFRLGLKG